MRCASRIPMAKDSGLISCLPRASKIPNSSFSFLLHRGDQHCHTELQTSCSQASSEETASGSELCRVRIHECEEALRPDLQLGDSLAVNGCCLDVQKTS